jgi:threonine/homoserine/homoserine lactone efflux protein
VIVATSAGVGQVVGALLPLAVVVALSPAPIIAVVLMLLTPRAGGTSASFLMGWVVGLAGVTTVFLLLTGDLAQQSRRRSSEVASWAELGLGVLLLTLAVHQWRSRPRAGEERGLPRWVVAIDRFTAARAGGLGLVLSTVNPKVLLVCIAAGATIAGGGLSGVHATWSVVVFTITAASTVALPVLGYAMGGTRITGPLELLRSWLTAHGATAAATLLLVLGFVLVGQGWGGLV